MNKLIKTFKINGDAYSFDLSAIGATVGDTEIGEYINQRGGAVKLTKAEYDAIEVKNPTIIYIVEEEDTPEEGGNEGGGEIEIPEGTPVLMWNDNYQGFQAYLGYGQEWTDFVNEIMAYDSYQQLPYNFSIIIDDNTYIAEYAYRDDVNNPHFMSMSFDGNSKSIVLYPDGGYEMFGFEE